jgi:ribosomal protein S12 methylthiotransferase accessory factor
MDMTISFPGGVCVDAQYGDMVIKTDQPPQGGGDGSAPTPFALFVASMGTCAGIYVLSFCQQRGLPTEDIHIHQHVEFDPGTHLARKVTLHIDLPADFPSKYESALVKTANLCAVKRHLENPPDFAVETHIGGVD